MKQILLATALIALPVAGFTAFTIWRAPATVTQASLGDLSAMSTIVADVQTIAATGDFTKAEARITDFETAWDDGEATLRPLNTMAWGTIDQAADHALTALRTTPPDAGSVTSGLTELLAALADPNQSTATTGPVALVAGVVVTDAAGRALPCETMLKDVASALTQTKASAADVAAATAYQTKALERCNADDDANADANSAQALALLLPNQG